MMQVTTQTRYSVGLMENALKDAVTTRRWRRDALTEASYRAHDLLRDVLPPGFWLGRGGQLDYESGLDPSVVRTILDDTFDDMDMAAIAKGDGNGG